MDTQDRYIVATDLGSSKIALIVAKINGENTEIVYYKETPSVGIRYSSIFNPTQVSEPLTEAIHDAENAIGIKITQIVTGMPKFPIRLETNTGKIEGRGEDADITEEHIADLKRSAQDLYPLEDPKSEAIYGSVAQSFSDGENFQIIENDIIGMSSDVLEGNFKIFIGKKSSLTKIDSALKKANVVAARKYFTAECTAKAVLTEAEMENGVALIDFGGGSTSVAIYHGNIMRHYASIPFGGGNITTDIQIESEGSINKDLAENIKLAFGACMPDKLQNLGEKIIHIKSDNGEAEKKLPVKYLSEIITARVEEILMAIFYEIQQSGFADRLRSGIVVTGGCAQTANLGNLIYDISGYRVRTGYPKTMYSLNGCEGVTDTSATTALGLILAARNEPRLNCAYSNDSLTEDEVRQETVQDNAAPADVTAEPFQKTLFPSEETDVGLTEKDKEKIRSNKRLTWTKPFVKIGKLFDEVYDMVNE